VDTLVEKPRLLPRSGDERWSAAHSTKGAARMLAEGDVILRAQIWQFMAFPVDLQELNGGSPEPAPGVQFRSIGWQPLSRNPTSLLLEGFLHQVAPRARRATPKDQRLPAQGRGKMLEEVDNLLPPLRPWIEAEAEVSERGTGDGRKRLPVEVVLEPRMGSGARQACDLAGPACAPSVGARSAHSRL